MLVTTDTRLSPVRSNWAGGRSAGTMRLSAGLRRVGCVAAAILISRAADASTVRLADAMLHRPYAVSLPLASAVGELSARTTRGSLPDGLKLEGLWIRGRPGKLGDYSFVLRVTDDIGQQVTATFAIRVVSPSAAKPAFVNLRLPACTTCVPYASSIVVEGGHPPYKFSIMQGRLPAGLSMDTRGTVTGTYESPETVGRDVSLGIRVTDELGQQVRGSVALPLRPNPWVLLELWPLVEGDDRITMPVAVLGRPYEFIPPHVGGYGELRWKLTGALPKGLRFALPTGALAGTPEVTGRFDVSVSISDTIGQRAQRDCRLVVLPGVPDPVTIHTDHLPIARLGEQYLALLEARGGVPPYEWQVVDTKLPGGMSFKDGWITGTPSRASVAGEYAVRVRVRDRTGGEDGPVELKLVVTRNDRFPAPTIPVKELPQATAGLPYGASVPVVGGLPPLSFKMVEAQIPPGLQMDGRGVLTGTPTEVGRHELHIVVMDALGQSTAGGDVTLGLKVNHPPPSDLAVSTRKLPVATIGTPYRVPLVASGGYPPYRWEVTAGDLPAWARLVEHGVLHGTPPAVGAVGTHGLTVAVADNRSSRVEGIALELRVAENPAFPPPRVACDNLPAAVVGAPYESMIPISGGMPPCRVDVQGEMPAPWLRMDSSGIVRGTPRGFGRWALQVRATDALGQRSPVTGVVLVAHEAAPTHLRIGRCSPASGIVGKLFAYQVPVSGGELPYTFLPAQPPPGIVFDAATGALSGVPTEPGRRVLDVVVRDGATPAATQAVKLEINIGAAREPADATYAAVAVVFAVLAVSTIATLIVVLVRERRKASQSSDEDAETTRRGSR